MEYYYAEKMFFWNSEFYTYKLNVSIKCKYIMILIYYVLFF